MSQRTATQEFTVRDVLTRHCGAALTPGFIDVVAAELMAEMTKGPTAWAFSDEANHLRARVAFLTGEIHAISERLTIAEQLNAELMESSSTVIGACESAIKHVLHNLKASGKRVDIGLAGSSCDEALRRVDQFRKAHAQPTESGTIELFKDRGTGEWTICTLIDRVWSPVSPSYLRKSHAIKWAEANGYKIAQTATESGASHE
jgi:hypothetical protein